MTEEEAKLNYIENCEKFWKTTRSWVDRLNTQNEEINSKTFGRLKIIQTYISNYL